MTRLLRATATSVLLGACSLLLPLAWVRCVLGGAGTAGAKILLLRP
jgi:hypothetical protein